MLSASHEEVEPLVGVDPDDTTVVTYGGAQFTLGVLPAGKWDVLEAQYMVARQESIRRVIKSLNERGIDPSAVAVKTKDGVEVSEADIAVSQDVQFLEDSLKVISQALKLSLRGHARFVNRTNQPFPFDREEGGAVSARTMAVYHSNPKLMRALWAHVRILNDLSLAAKKV